MCILHDMHDVSVVEQGDFVGVRLSCYGTSEPATVRDGETVGGGLSWFLVLVDDKYGLCAMRTAVRE